MTTPDFSVSHLERTYNAAAVKRQRRQIRELLGALEGEAVIDLGCGPGHLAAELAEDVGPRGRVIALDREPEMVGAAKAKAGRHNAQFVVADVTAVPVASGQLDRAVAVQVFEYVPDPEHALAELRRVLKPGGTAVVVDTDWRSAVWHADDRQRTDAVLRTWENHFEHPHLPTVMPRLARSAGFGSVEVVALSMVETEAEGDTYSMGMAATISRFVGRSEPALARGWRADIKAQSSRGEYFFSLNRFATILCR